MTNEKLETITLKEPHDFLSALRKMVNGECLGIRPGNNTLFMREYGGRLMWQGGETATCRIEQFTEQQWFLVIVDHRNLSTD